MALLIPRSENDFNRQPLAVASIVIAMAMILLLAVISHATAPAAVSAQSQTAEAKNSENSDLVTNIPGLDTKLNYPTYAGYLDAFANGRKSHLFYWFIRSDSPTPDSDPLVLWLNGGPGSSSLLGLLKEIGPFRAYDDGKKLFMHQYPWNKGANLLFLESPAGVGFSYEENDNIDTNDDQVADDNYAAMVSFFKKYPQYKDTELYILGQSYAGIYLTTLATRFIKNKAEFPGKFTGILIGNGLLSAKDQQNSLVYLQYYRGAIGFDEWEELNQECCGDPTKTCNWYDSLARTETTRPTYFESNGSRCGDLTLRISLNLIKRLKGITNINQYQDCYAKDNSQAMWKNAYYGRDNNKAGPMIPPDLINYDSTDSLGGFQCWMGKATIDYFNRADVRRALHVSDKALKKWASSNPDFSSGKRYKRTYLEMDDTMSTILKDPDVRVLVYNGDVDSLCNFLGAEWFVRRVAEANGLSRETRKPWYFKGRIAGWAQKYDRIQLATVKGAGHNVPTDRAGPAQQLFMNFINRKALNTTLPDSSTVNARNYRPPYIARNGAIVQVGSFSILAALLAAIFAT